jgi:hypothetical protein
MARVSLAQWVVLSELAEPNKDNEWSVPNRWLRSLRILSGLGLASEVDAGSRGFRPVWRITEAGKAYLREVPARRKRGER